MTFGYCIGHLTIEDADAYKEYAAKAPAAIAAFGGEYLVRGGSSEVKEGTFPGDRTVIIRFPSFAAAKNWYESAEYSAIRPLREAYATGGMILVEGL